ncbi:LUD domain-containing protein [Stieleria sp. TO1_6]|uniref:LutC/YkgG family protein n=1 Tax=Stieleria tagensis TaxID=2956795 RepID=UPI00209A72F4|nr:LUD domain-containing protein [Stieleria tagensis]MCO8121117.1 LUD domain-containing protein [Stieleria tagensis]
MTDTPQADVSARQSILDRIRTKQVHSAPLPTIDFQRVQSFDDPLDRFAQSLVSVGGQAHMVDSVNDVKPIMDQIPVFRDASQIVSLVPECIRGTVDTAAIHDPHTLSDVDWTIARGEFLVAENGSIWVDGNTLPHRVLLFIAQYLAIVVPKSEIVATMHHAYQRIEGFDGRFGIFVSGPSKTADIEQSLVLGAHGCRKLQVFIVDQM